MFADHQIKKAVEAGDVYIDPYDSSLVQPASLDMRLGSEFVMYADDSQAIDPAKPDNSKLISFYSEKIIISPGQFILGSTLEEIGLCSEIAARVEGKSTLGRIGLIIHSTAGFVDPGFRGKITLEMTNINSRPIILRSGMRICQMAFHKMSEPAELPYGHDKLGSHYHNQSGVTPAAALV